LYGKIVVSHKSVSRKDTAVLVIDYSFYFYQKFPIFLTLILAFLLTTFKTLKTHKNISPETIKAYLAGTLSHAQTHEFEKAMMDDAVLWDMVEGYELLRDKKADLQKINISLSDSLSKKINKEQTEIYPLWKRVPVYARAASVLLFLGIGTYFFTKKDTITIEENVASTQPLKQAPLAKSEVISPSENENLPKGNIKAEMDKIQSENKVVAVQKSKSKAAFDSVIANAEVVAIESKKDRDFETDEVVVTAKPAPTASEPTPAPVQAPAASVPRASTQGASTPSGVMKSEESVSNKSRAKRATANSNFISGTVLDEDSKEPVPNVEILSDDKTIGKTDANGRFNINNSLINNKLNLVAPNFENTEIKVINGASEPLFIRPKAELIFIDLKRNKTWKYNPSEHSAQPTVSPDDYLEYLKKNLKKPKQAADNQIVGNVTVEFKVNREGKLSDFKIIKSLGYGCDEEAIRVIKDGPNWMSKVSGGEPRRQRVRQEVSF
jgi:TonB family protein